MTTRPLLYSLALVAFPAAFRRTYAADMLATYELRATEKRRAGLWTYTRFLGLELAAVFKRGLRMRGTEFRRSRRDRAARRFRSPLGHDVRSDVRYAVRNLIRTPGFAAISIVTLALGIGGNTAIFTLINDVLLRPPPFAAPDRLVAVFERNERGEDINTIAPANFRDWVEGNNTLESLAGYYLSSMTVTGEGTTPEYVSAAMVTPGFFETLGVPPALGRWFLQGEGVPGAPQVVLLGHDLWMRRFHGDSSAVGGTLEVAGSPYEIVGVMPPGITIPEDVAAWRPMKRSEEAWANRGSHYLKGIGRLAPGTDLATAHADLLSIADRLATEYPSSNEGWRVTTMPLADSLVGNVRGPLMLLQGAVFLVLLIACVNVANLQLARGSTRRHEFALRAALGASRGRILRQVLTESIVLAAAGAAGGIAVAWFGLEMVGMLTGHLELSLADVRMDRTALVFTALVALGTGLVFGVVPALQQSRSSPSRALRATGNRLTRAGGREALVAVEIALSVVLLVSAGLLVNSFYRLQRVDPGFDPTNVLSMRVTIPASRYSEPDARAAFFQQLHERAGSIPGVHSVAMVSNLPVTGVPSLWRNHFHRPEHPPQSPSEQVAAYLRWVSPGYFATMNVPVLQGRTFTDLDRGDGRRVVVIDKAMADEFFPGENPIGKRLMIHYNDWEGEIVGVVGSSLQTDLRDAPDPHMYVSYLQTYEEMFLASMHVVFKTMNDPLSLVEPARREVFAIDPLLAPHQIETVEQRLADSLSRERFTLFLIAAFAVVAVILSAVGLYGVVSYLVGQRTQEFGIRLALGATTSDVFSLVMKLAARLALVGAGAGVVIAIGSARALSGLLFGVEPSDPATILAVSALLALVTGLASFLPARRAARLPPMTALRHE